jgi:biopolymer transport protein ExbB
MSGILQTVIAGGPMIWLLILLSFFSLALIALKMLQLRGVLSGGAVRARALAAWATGDKTGASAMLAQGRSPADRLVHAAMQGLIAGQRRPALEAELDWRGNVEMAALTRHIRLLEIIAMVSPLMGLLGTVLGMIEAFQELAKAEGAANASLLAGGIWTALLTTAAGLAVAIPAAVAAGLFSERTDRAALQIESAVGELFALEDARR